MSRTVQIVLPGLFDLPLHELKPQLLRQELPHLNQILRRATTRPNQAHTIDAILGSALAGHDSVNAEPAGLPMAQAFASSGAGEAERMLLCQAIHLRPDMHSAVIVPIPVDQENLEDINIIINDLCDLFKVDYDINTIADGLFLLHLKQFEAPTHYPHILSVLGKTANPYIEQSRQNLAWYKLLNEIQMFMHQHPANQRRLQRGLLPINSLWFWGAGRGQKAPDSNLEWFCDDPLLNRFASSLGLAPRPCAEVDTFANPGNALVIDLRLLELLKTQRSFPLDELLLDIDRQLLKPLLSMLRKGRAQIVLRAGYEFDFILKPSALMKFWRPQRNLLHWIAIGDSA